MTPAAWIACGLVVVGYVGVFLALRACRRELTDLCADLDDADERMDDLTRELSYLRDELHGSPTGRHAADSPSTGSSQTVH